MIEGESRFAIPPFVAAYSGPPQQQHVHAEDLTLG